MKIITLLENQTESKCLINKHGLSLYIEVNGIKVIFDTGPDDSFMENANTLGVNVSEVDYLIISHGHNNHGGGIKAFIRANDNAKIIMSKHAFNAYYARYIKFLKVNVGLNPKLKDSDRIVLLEGTTPLSHGLVIFDDVNSNKLVPTSNAKLLMKKDNKYVLDDFKHEINLLILENNKTSLICGCSHSGIVNIIEKAKTISNGIINTVIGGMHLSNPTSIRSENNELINELGDILLTNGIDNYYTCHCTGEKAYNLLKIKLESKINYLKTGTSVKI